MKKSLKIFIAGVLAVAVVLTAIIAIFPGIAYYPLEMYKLQKRHYSVESYAFSDLKADAGAEKIKQYGVTVLIPEGFELYREPKKEDIPSTNDPGIIKISTPKEADAFDFKFFITYERDMSDKKYEKLKEKFIEMYGSDTLSGYAYQKMLYEDSVRGGYRLHDKYQSYINYALNAERANEIHYLGGVYSPIEKDDLRGYLLKFGYGSELKENTMLEFAFYNTEDESKKYCITYFCMNAADVENAYESINSITFE